MSREIYVTMEEGAVVAACQKEKVGISAIERLPEGGIRLVCMSSDGAGTMRAKFKRNLIAGEVAREKIRPTRPLW